MKATRALIRRAIGIGLLALLLAGALAPLARPAAAAGTHELDLYTWYCNPGNYYAALTLQQAKDKCRAGGGGLGLFQTTYKLAQNGQVIATKTGGAPVEFLNVPNPGAQVRAPILNNYALRVVYCQDGAGGYAKKLIFPKGLYYSVSYNANGQSYTNCHLFYAKR